MKNFYYVISDPRGLHARNAVQLSKAAESYHSTIQVTCMDREGDVKNVITLMTMAAVMGETLCFTVEGDDEAEAASYLEALVKVSL